MEAPVIWDEGFNLTQLIYVVELQQKKEMELNNFKKYKKLCKKKRRKVERRIYEMIYDALIKLSKQ